MMNRCFLCGCYTHTERHHIFGGALRSKSDQLGLYVDLCPGCHRHNANAAHRSRETQQLLHEYGQRQAMKWYGWTIADFVRNFYKNYLVCEAREELMDDDFELLPAEALPF